MKTQWIWMFSLIAVAAGGCVNRGAQEQAKKTQEIVTNPKISVVLAKAESRSISDMLEITGEVTTSNDSVVGAKLPGKVIATYVKDGDTVSAGQLLAEIDGSSQRLQIQQAEAQASSARSALSQALANATVGPQKSAAAVSQAQAALRSAKAQLQKALNGARPEEKAQATAALQAAKSNLDTAKRELERVQKLVRDQVASQQRLEQAQNAYNSAEAQYNQAQAALSMQENWTRPEDISTAREAVRQAEEGLKTAQAGKHLDVLLQQQVEAAQANVRSAQSQVALARQALADLQIRAPFSGKIFGKPTQPGSVLGSGSPVARIVGSGGVYFEGDLPATSLESVHSGDPVTVTIDGLPDRTFSGVVYSISPSASSIGRLFRARISLSTASEMVKPGMFARGKVTVRTVANATVVPTEAIVTRGEKSAVFVSKDGKAKMVEVKPGLKTDGHTQVTGALNPGDEVVISGQNDLDDGSQIEVKPTEGKSASLKGSPWA